MGHHAIKMLLGVIIFTGILVISLLTLNRANWTGLTEQWRQDEQDTWDVLLKKICVPWMKNLALSEEFPVATFRDMGLEKLTKWDFCAGDPKKPEHGLKKETADDVNRCRAACIELAKSYEKCKSKISGLSYDEDDEIYGVTVTRKKDGSYKVDVKTSGGGTKSAYGNEQYAVVSCYRERVSPSDGGGCGDDSVRTDVCDKDGLEGCESC